MTLAGYVAVLRRRLLVVMLCLVAGLLGAFLQVHRTPKMYEAVATYFVTLPGNSGTNADVQANAVNVAEDFLSSFQSLAGKRSTADATATALGIDPGLVEGHLSSSIEAGTFYIDVTATSTQPDQARVIADGAAQVITQLIPKIQASSKNPAGATVTDRAVLPSTAYQPRPKRTAALGGLVGLVVGLAIVGLLEALDRTTRTADEAALLAGAPLLGVVPRRKSVSTLVEGQLREPYRSLRAAVHFLKPDDPPVTILVTSPVPGDGKTTTAVNLAGVLAEAGSSVLLIDGDLRRASLSRSYGVRKAPGVTSVITREVSLADCLLQQDGLILLPAGPTPPNPSELLGSQSAVDILSEVRGRFDYVVIDAPPLLAVSDSLALAPHVDAIVLVVRHAKTPRTAVVESRRRLEALGRTVDGVVDNAVPRREVIDYYGRYSYVED